MTMNAMRRLFQRPMRRRSLLAMVYAAAVWPAGSAPAASARRARTLRIGPSREYRTPSAAAAAAADGDVIEIDAGEYAGDTAVWSQDRIVIRSVGGAVRLSAAGASAEGKAIWIVRGGKVAIAGVEFSGARVADRNGAGIRLERGQLTVRDCVFRDNENGILTANDRDIELHVAACEFGHNGHGDGYSHNLYAGAIGRLSVTESYLHHARSGHLLKSRAARNDILCNRLTDEEGGRASYELEFPSGGVAVVVGNIVAQGARTENPVLVSFGAEGFRWSRNALYLVNNTLVDERGQDGAFLRVRAGAGIFAANNLLAGDGRLETAGDGIYRNNPNAVRTDFVDLDRHDYRLRSGSRFATSGLETVAESDVDVRLRREYVHPKRSRPVSRERLLPGALQEIAGAAALGFPIGL